MKTAAAALCCALAVLPHLASAATFTPVAEGEFGNIGTIIITGAIEDGDDKAFHDTTAGMELLGVTPTVIELDSPGGKVLPAAKIADEVAHREMPTSVRAGRACLSSCVMIFFAGPDHWLFAGGLLGVHRASDKDGHDAPEASRFIADKLASFKVPQATIDIMLTTPALSISWLHAGRGSGIVYEDEIERCGAPNCDVGDWRRHRMVPGHEGIQVDQPARPEETRCFANGVIYRPPCKH